MSSWNKLGQISRSKGLVPILEISQGIFLWNMRMLTVIGKNRVFKELRGQGQRVKKLVPTERSCHKKLSCEISKNSAQCWKVIKQWL